MPQVRLQETISIDSDELKKPKDHQLEPAGGGGGGGGGIGYIRKTILS
jgi:hypothetical protein